jgi:hypothetical protein
VLIINSTQNSNSTAIIPTLQIQLFPSYEEALNIHLLLMEDMQKKRIRLKPVIYLVANKIDQNPHSDQFHQIITSAELYSQQKMIRFWQVRETVIMNIPVRKMNIISQSN